MRSAAQHSFAALCLLLAACKQPSAVPPGFAGVPELMNRSDDLALPLAAADRAALVAFLAARGVRGEPPDAAGERSAEAAYGRVLDALARGASTLGDLEPLFAPEEPMAIHDARVAVDEFGEPYDLDRPRCCGFVHGDYVFAFYLRRLEPVAVADPGVAAWRLLPPASGGADAPFTGLVVFRTSFAVATPAH
jgi:hypothetical protein